MPSKNALFQQRGEVTRFSQCSMGDGVRHHALPIARTQNTANRTGAEMEKAAHGQMMFIS